VLFAGAAGPQAGTEGEPVSRSSSAAPLAEPALPANFKERN
jgi:hypothetical protein